MKGDKAARHRSEGGHMEKTQVVKLYQPNQKDRNIRGPSWRAPNVKGQVYWDPCWSPPYFDGC